MHVSVILPTYNEKGNIIGLIDVLLEHLSPMKIDKEIIVVDDNSPDGTGSLVRDRYRENADVKVFVRTEEKGLATAIRYGIEKSRGDIIAVMDTDFNHDPRMLPRMIKFLEYYDIVVGSRFTSGGGMYDNFRYLGSYFFNFLIRIVLLTRLQDNLSGFFTVRREFLFSMDFDKIFFGYGDYFFRLLYHARLLNVKILDIPVVYQKRKSGQRKRGMFSILIQYTVALIKTRFAK
jgi:dolichol-phosphate mannosyltransferase